MLTREQIAAFKRDGTLVLENFAPESQLDTWVSWVQLMNLWPARAHMTFCDSAARN
jgi:accessory colonization factor AcfC